MQNTGKSQQTNGCQKYVKQTDARKDFTRLGGEGFVFIELKRQ